jgi:2-dehydropantoate 2-reductase
MRHVVLGAGGVGGLIGGALARAGQPVTLVLRPSSLAAYPGRLRVESQVLGGFEVEVPAVARAEDGADVLWVAVKATQLEPALAGLPGTRVQIPLLNGIEHVARLRELPGAQVLAGTIAVEAEREEAGHIVQRGPFLRVQLGASSELQDRAGAVAAELQAAGIECHIGASEAQVLWEKLGMLAPMALGTTGAAAPIGEVRALPEVWPLVLECVREVAAVAATQGATVDSTRLQEVIASMPDGMRSSMQKDLAAGHALELDAIGGPIVRLGLARGIPTPATEELMRRVAARDAAREAARTTGRTEGQDA